MGSITQGVGTLVSPIEGLKHLDTPGIEEYKHVGTLVSPIEGLKHPLVRSYAA